MLWFELERDAWPARKPIQTHPASKVPARTTNGNPYWNRLMTALKNGLYVVATPIGNLGDISARAIDVLKNVQIIACEDTRVSGKLLSRASIETGMTPYHDHNAEKVRPGLLAEMEAGAAIALISDAGMPAISDPGYKLVRACIEADIPVTVVPGANAALTGLVLSGLPTDRFLFQGYLPSKSGQRVSELEELADIPATLLFYESGKRLAKSLADMQSVLGPRPAAVARELTKLHEEVRRGTLAELAGAYETEGPPKGEIVVIVAPPEPPEPPSELELEVMLAGLLGRLSVKDAAAEVAEITKIPRKTLYEMAVRLQNELKDDDD